MKHLISLLLAPTLALCGTFSGTVVSLDGTPVVGAVIKAGTDSVTTTPNGSWALARTTGMSARTGKTIPVTSHLLIENGRPRLSFGGLDISGRALSLPRATRSGVEGMRTTAARSSADRDTLKVYWKGKRLTVLTVPTDTAVTFRIDTAWKDDAGIPWNPRVNYGSLYDARDGQTYRTVTISYQTWMAENLNFAPSNSQGTSCASSNAGECPAGNRLYTWPTAMDTIGCETRSCNDSAWKGVTYHLDKPIQGVCPSGWILPSNAHLDSVFWWSGYLQSSLKSASGWAANSSTDSMGFRGLPLGYRDANGNLQEHGTKARWWSASDSLSTAKTRALLDSFVNYWLYLGDAVDKRASLPVRCMSTAARVYP